MLLLSLPLPPIKLLPAGGVQPPSCVEQYLHITSTSATANKPMLSVPAMQHVQLWAQCVQQQMKQFTTYNDLFIQNAELSRTISA